VQFITICVPWKDQKIRRQTQEYLHSFAITEAEQAVEAFAEH
jgi:hypothetical protein